MIHEFTKFHKFETVSKHLKAFAGNKRIKFRFNRQLTMHPLNGGMPPQPRPVNKQHKKLNSLKPIELDRLVEGEIKGKPVRKESLEAYGNKSRAAQRWTKLANVLKTVSFLKTHQARVLVDPVSKYYLFLGRNHL
jgi:hypothetical protein